MYRSSAPKSNMRYKYVHDCKKPSMITGSIEVESGRWFWKKTEVWNTYETRQIKWACDCGTKWSWNPSYNKTIPGLWWCDFRPEVWKDVE